MVPTCFISKSLDRFQMISNRLWAAQSRKNSYVDHSIRPLKFGIGVQVFLHGGCCNDLICKNFFYTYFYHFPFPVVATYWFWVVQIVGMISDAIRNDLGDLWCLEPLKDIQLTLVNLCCSKCQMAIWKVSLVLECGIWVCRVVGLGLRPLFCIRDAGG